MKVQFLLSFPMLIHSNLPATGLFGSCWLAFITLGPPICNAENLLQRIFFPIHHSVSSLGGLTKHKYKVKTVPRSLLFVPPRMSVWVVLELEYCTPEIMKFGKLWINWLFSIAVLDLVSAFSVSSSGTEVSHTGHVSIEPLSFSIAGGNRTIIFFFLVLIDCLGNAFFPINKK